MAASPKKLVVIASWLQLMFGLGWLVLDLLILEIIIFWIGELPVLYSIAIPLLAFLFIFLAVAMLRGSTLARRCSVGLHVITILLLLWAATQSATLFMISNTIFVALMLGLLHKTRD